MNRTCNRKCVLGRHNTRSSFKVFSMTTEVPLFLDTWKRFFQDFVLQKNV